MPMTWERVGSSAFSSGIISILLQLHHPTPLLSEVLQLFKVTRRRVVVVTSSRGSSCNNCNYSCIIPRPFSLKRFPLHHPIASKSPYIVVSPYVCLSTSAYNILVIVESLLFTFTALSLISPY
jgi:hypothetical protein